MKGQTHLHSTAEALLNTLIGFAINIVVQIYIFKAFGINITIAENFEIGFAFLVVSTIRSYVIRRWFNVIMLRKYTKQIVE
ncbi:MAG: hypothetical protein QXN55_00030 [Candidatus Nitrosotenuis sp.]